ncbi:MAG TPA: TIGR02281 family clan AA aspartic protease [Hyphomicrobiaceae bacterium]|nr:TIGR02281 family clan AA aspartic protease [Hyphomicrobiaceae bacterium]
MAGLILLMLIVCGGAFLLVRSDPQLLEALSHPDSMMIAYGVIFLIVVGVPLIATYRGRFGTAIRDLLAWTGLAAILVAGYSFREDLTGLYYRMAGELMPPGTLIEGGTTPTGDRSVRIRRRPDSAKVGVNGTAVGMIIDTGASTVVLKQSDAVSIGIDPKSLVYSVPVQTANGQTFAARVRLTSVSIGSIRVEQVEALVARPGALRESLLGMSFLSRLKSYEFSGDYLTLRI